MGELPRLLGGPGAPGLDAERRLLCVHAHPDDEASKGAATVAREAARGTRVSLVTCTGGEAGEVLNEALLDFDLTTLAKVREQELLEATAILGFAAVYLLGYPDSGWFEDLEQVPAETFWGADLDEAAGRLAAVLLHERPQVVMTYPEDGGYPHPDHIKVHAVTMRAVELAAAAPERPWTVDRVVASTVWTMEKMLAMDEESVRRKLPRAHEKWIASRRERGLVEAPVDIRVQVGDWLEHRDRALLAHATQVDPTGPWFAHSREVELAVAPWEDFHLISGDVPEHPSGDLFAGLVDDSGRSASPGHAAQKLGDPEAR